MPSLPLNTIVSHANSQTCSLGVEILRPTQHSPPADHRHQHQVPHPPSRHAWLAACMQQIAMSHGALYFDLYAYTGCSLFGVLSRAWDNGLAAGFLTLASVHSAVHMQQQYDWKCSDHREVLISSESGICVQEHQLYSLVPRPF